MNATLAERRAELETRITQLTNELDKSKKAEAEKFAAWREAVGQQGESKQYLAWRRAEAEKMKLRSSLYTVDKKLVHFNKGCG